MSTDDDEEEEADGFDPLCAINRNPIVGEVYFISIKVSDQGLLCVLGRKYLHRGRKRVGMAFICAIKEIRHFMGMS